MRSIRRLAAAAVLLVAAFAPTPSAAKGGPLWLSPVVPANVVVSSPTTGGGYLENPPVPGGCGLGSFNANHSESDLAVQPGTDTLVGTSKFFFDRFSTFYNFYLGSYDIQGGRALSNNQVQGYDCLSTGSQAMPPSWTNTTDPNDDFDTQGRVYQTVLPFNAFWTNLHPNGEITASYSDDLGAHWVTGNGGRALESVPNESSFSFHFEDKQWIAVNHFPGSPYQDHVYSVWDLGNSAGNTVEVREATSRDRGQTFSPAQTVGSPSVAQNRNAFPIDAVGPDGSVYVAWSNIGGPNSTSTGFYVTRSTDDAVTFSTPVLAATTNQLTNAEVNGALPNTNFRDGVPMGFAASPDLPGHLYMAYENAVGGQYDVYFVQSTDYGQHWSAPVKVNDNVDAAGVPTDQWQPQVAAGPGGAVAVGFYDRRAACPNDPSVIRQDVGRTNFCIDLSVQPFKDSGAGAAPVGANVRASLYTWDPQQPGLLVHDDGTTSDLQTLGGFGQMACASADDPCSLSFIGDYFGMAISATGIYTLSVSTHYPSNVKADDRSTLYYQQQVLATIDRAQVGI